jgi:hypothetical protein
MLDSPAQAHFPFERQSIVCSSMYAILAVMIMAFLWPLLRS